MSFKMKRMLNYGWFCRKCEKTNYLVGKCRWCGEKRPKKDK